MLIDLPDLPLPGRGDTLERLRGLAALGRADLVACRLAEGHADAVAIRTELGDEPGDDGRWGVWAAAPSTVRAERAPEGWRLTGDRPWCPGAAWCTDALVTAVAEDGIRLFAVRNEGPYAQPLEGTWPAIGMSGSDSRTVRFTGAPARPVGGPGEYAGRPGFWHGGIGVAACWYGGALAVADTLLAAARSKELGPHALAHLGAVDVALGAAWAVLEDAARRIDAEPRADAGRLALRARAVVESAATEVIDRVGRALGADPLCRDVMHAQRIVDLTVYLRQSHAESDLEQLGHLLVEEGAPW
ncbi:acyl-CoA dehydrogenase [Actinoplanes cyaneus]|uniref:Acyl-CoA dehydrogenase n=1 Tax=Actinoplanes cyaneus TaxID=52696 RepID=A0A919IHZ7_9ACTN|nr:acyl-CoA dehydrogenase family protein [Actinoplanes cyaneus]GID65712.1 acyl-CoA dehydrogenase [Actinoplanes cyaneus]